MATKRCVCRIQSVNDCCERDVHLDKWNLVAEMYPILMKEPILRKMIVSERQILTSMWRISIGYEK